MTIETGLSDFHKLTLKNNIASYKTLKLKKLVIEFNKKCNNHNFQNEILNKFKMHNAQHITIKTRARISLKLLNPINTGPFGGSSVPGGGLIRPPPPT